MTKESSVGIFMYFSIQSEVKKILQNYMCFERAPLQSLYQNTNPEGFMQA